MKACCTCKETKTAEKFSKNKTNKDGLSRRCKDCDKKAYRSRYIKKGYQRKWNKENTKEDFLRHIQDKGDLYKFGRTKNTTALYQAILREWGSVKELCDHLGLNHEKLITTTKWNEEKISELILEINEKEGEVCYSIIHQNNPKLASHLVHNYGGVSQAIFDLGLHDKVNFVIKKREWTALDVEAELLQLVKQGHNMTYRSVYSIDSGLMKACNDIFGSYKSALNHIGINYEEEVIGDRLGLMRIGQKMEPLCLAALKKSGIKLRDSKLIRTADSYILPDAVSEDGEVFYDFKLSSWTLFNSDTYAKYKNHCKKLVIIYLRGDEPSSKYYGDKVEFIKLIDLINKCPDNDSLIAEYREISKQLKECC